MSLHFRHFKSPEKYGLRRGDFKYGIVLYDNAQPTLDILFNNHVFVVFWKRKERK